MKGWRPALRLAWRDAWKAKGRSILVLVMIALPVLAVTAASVVLATSDVSGAESVNRRLGAADALVRAEGIARPVVQSPDPDKMGSWSQGPKLDQPVSPEIIGATLGREVRAIDYAESYVQVVKGDRAIDVEVTEVDLRDPIAAGLFRLTSGELPSGPGEVVINNALAERGIGIGDALTLRAADESPTVVGIGESAKLRDYEFAAGPVGSLGLDEVSGLRSWLIDADGPVTWSEVLALNKIGGAVVSEAVLIDPPDLSAIADQMGISTGEDQIMAVIALVVTMALLEVVLLAGPAFAVGARRQSRSLALLAASGGTPSQSRRVVLASGVVLGGLAALIGIVLGVLVGIAMVPVAQTQNRMWFGPLEVRWSYVAAIAAFGLLSALLAAVVPAWIASRQDVVAVLAGRRGDRPPTAKSPVLGLVLLLAGTAGAAYGATHPDGGEYWIAASAIVAVFGMIFVVPLVVSLVSRLAGRMPLTMRYAARDAARHRTRTVPAVAAVAATVAGVVALGIATTSDEADNAATYSPQLAMGDARVTWSPDFNDLSADSPDWDLLASIAADHVPGAAVTRLVGLQETLPGGDSVHLEFFNRSEPSLVSGWSNSYGSSVLVSDDALPSVLTAVSGDDRERADAALQAGRPVVFTSFAPTGAPTRMRGTIWHSETQTDERIRARDVDAEVVQIDGEFAPVLAVVPSALLESVGQTPTTIGLMLTDEEISEDQEKAAMEAIAGAVPGADFYVERGYQPPDEVFVLQLVLFTLGGVLMVGGTLTATFLALSDARPDLATLAAVGAAPRSRRGVAASYALVVGFVGALLGAAVGFIPGIAIARPLTLNTASYLDENGVIGTPGTGPFLDVPWLMILGLVIALPLLTALIVGLTARSRLPLAARLT